jgi:hypothetical protein
MSFPLPQDLTLGKLVSSVSPDSTAREAQNITRLLKRVAPNLECLDVGVEDPISTMIEEYFR